MTRKQKDRKKWIAADDAVFTGGDPWDLACTFLDGYVDEIRPFADDTPNPEFKFLRPGSREEARAREALVQVLRSTVVGAMRDKLTPPSDLGLFLVLLRLADLFDEQERPYRLPQRKLVFKARSGRRHPTLSVTCELSGLSTPNWPRIRTTWKPLWQQHKTGSGAAELTFSACGKSTGRCCQRAPRRKRWNS